MLLYVYVNNTASTDKNPAWVSTKKPEELEMFFEEQEMELVARCTSDEAADAVVRLYARKVVQCEYCESECQPAILHADPKAVKCPKHGTVAGKHVGPYEMGKTPPLAVAMTESYRRR